MPKRDDIAVRAHVLRSRIYNLEQKHASTGYPDERKKLAEQIAEALTEYRDLLPEIKKEAKRRKTELLRKWEEVHQERRDLLMLLGQLPEPQPTNAVGVSLGTAPPFEKVNEYPVAELRHHNEPTPQQPRLISKEEAAAYREMDNPSYWLKEAS